MANLSNINNILRTGSLGVGINRDPLGAFEISSATKPGIKMFNTAASGKTYEAYSDTNGNYIIYDQDADDNRFVINSAGNATFAGTGTFAGNVTLAKAVGDTELLIEADTNNNNENYNPRLHLRQDGGAISAYFGLNGCGFSQYVPKPLPAKEASGMIFSVIKLLVVVFSSASLSTIFFCWAC